MTHTAWSNITYHFDAYSLEPGERRLLRAGKQIKLTTKVFDLLVLLVQHGGHLVRKKELVGRLWPDSFVEESNLTVAIATLRRALGESREKRLIETVPKLGYRFIAAVTISSNSGPALTASMYSPNNPLPWSDHSTSKSEQVPSIAVLPLVNNSREPNIDYLCDGITETLINSLSGLSNLRVMARRTVFHYRGSDIDPLEAGRALGVTAVLIGSVTKVVEQLQVKVELIDTAHGWQFWGGQFTRTAADILTVGTDIIREMTGKLQVPLLEEERVGLAKRHTRNVEAQHAYLKGRYYWNKRTIEYFWKASAYFSRAIELDVTYALAYAGLADCYLLLNSYGALPPKQSIAKVRAATKEALALDNQLAEARASLGFVMLMYDWDLRGAEEELRHALRLNSNYATAHHWYANCLMVLGRLDEAMNERRTARELDPLAPILYTSVASQFIINRQYDEAIEECREALELDPYFYVAHAYIATATALSGRYEEAIRAAQECAKISNEPETLSLLGYIYASAGQKDQALTTLAELLSLEQVRYVDPVLLALLYCGLGETEPAFLWLETAFNCKSSNLIWLGLDERMNPLRADPRFTNLLQRIGLA